MHPYLSADMAAAHVADLLREAAARCCSVAVRRPVLERLRATLSRTTRRTPDCCPA